MAVESIAGISLDEGVKTSFAQHPEYAAELIRLFDDQQIIAMHAFKALINFSKDQRIASNLYDHVDKIISVILDTKSPFGDFASMLLSNITKFDGCHLKVCERLPELFNVFLKGSHGQVNYDFLAGVLADVTNTKEGREFFLGENFVNLFRLLPQLHSSKVMRRGGAASALKNCLFETEHHRAILDADDEEDRLLAHLIGLLASPKSNFDEEELEEMILDVQLEFRHTEAEPDATIRSMIMETLVIIGHSYYGREKMRAKKIYAVLREWHKLEPEEVLQDLAEKVVELLIRDESYEEADQ